MSNNTSTNVPGGNQGEPLANTPPNVGNSTSQGDQSTTASIEELKAKLAVLESKNAELISDNAKYRSERKKQEEAATQAAEQRLKEQGEYKQLAEQHAARVQELEPVSQRYHDLSLLVAGQIEATVKDWPPEVKAFDPGNDAPVEERLAWIEKSRPLVDKLLQQSRLPGNSPNPKPGSPTAEDQRNEFMRKLRQSGKYGG